jgi:hypothetical protein
MPAYSHRDHRVFRAAYRLLAAVAVLAFLLIAIGLVAPWPLVGALSVLALAALGGVALLGSDSIVAGYVDDVRAVARGDPVSPLVRVEVLSRIELERPVFVGGRPSPNHRRVRPDAPQAGLGVPGTGGSG